MEIGNKVEKVNGYKYPGIIVAKFKKINKTEERFVVECTEPSCIGMLHIFNERQLILIEEEENYLKKIQRIFVGDKYDWARLFS